MGQHIDTNSSFYIFLIIYEHLFWLTHLWDYPCVILYSQEDPITYKKGEEDMGTDERLNKLFLQLTAEQKEEIISFVESLIQAGESEPPSAPETISPKGYWIA